MMHGGSNGGRYCVRCGGSDNESDGMMYVWSSGERYA